ncbi:acyltransferase [Micromonospora sp. NPDC049679]|uniref:acyltransferase family protein n=1 Tax=Micromonospora sp. NPDC049679 TaxID=3155920 RepID=UPI0033DE214C
MRRLRQLAEQTPPSRERVVDLLRALAITAVVLGHWLVIVIGYAPDGRLTGHSALQDLPWARPVTWVVQVLPLFFLVGGYANAASLTSHRERGGDAVDWLLERAARLLRPTAVLLVVLAAAAFGARLLGADPVQTRTAVWFASIPLWFLSPYLGAVLLTPLMYRLHRRFGFAVPLLLVGLVALGDLARFRHAPDMLAAGNLLFGWLAIHQLGFAWRDGRLPARRAVALPLLFGGLTAALLATVVGPYPVSMINVPGERVHNMSPPSLALLALATAQIGLVLLLRDRAERGLRRPRPWQVVVAVNAVVLTIFLWHISAVLLVVGALWSVDLLPTPPVGSAAWLLWRLPWLLALSVALALLVAVFGRVELRGSRRPSRWPRWLPRRIAALLAHRSVRPVLTVVGVALAVLGLAGNNLAPKTAPALFGVPTTALVAFLLGMTILEMVRAAPSAIRAEERPPDRAG